MGEAMKRTFILREQRNLNCLLAFLAENWESMAQTKHPLQVDCQPESINRSTQQNKFYWQILQQISEQAWIEGKQYSAEIYHEHLKRRFIGCADMPGGGLMALSTTTLSVAEFAEYVTRCEVFAQQELGVELVSLEPVGRVV